MKFNCDDNILFLTERPAKKCTIVKVSILATELSMNKTNAVLKFTQLGDVNYSSQCLKITQKVSFNIAR